MTHQGFIGSLGTSAMLVASALAILLIVGTIVAFQGFPGPSIDDSTDAFPVQGLGSDAPKPELVSASPAPPPDVATGAATVTQVGPVGVAQTAAPPPPASEPFPPDEPAPASPVDPPTGSGTGGGDSSGGGSDPSIQETLTDTTRALESTVERLLREAEPVFDTLDRLAK